MVPIFKKVDTFFREHLLTNPPFDNVMDRHLSHSFVILYREIGNDIHLLEVVPHANVERKNQKLVKDTAKRHQT